MLATVIGYLLFVPEYATDSLSIYLIEIAFLESKMKATVSQIKLACHAAHGVPYNYVIGLVSGNVVHMNNAFSM